MDEYSIIVVIIIAIGVTLRGIAKVVAKGSAQKQVQAEPINWDEFEGKPKPLRRESRLPSEGIKSVNKPEAQIPIAEEKPKIEIDKRKLILYSEIMKPKFE